jgi:hypothetical protein
MDLNVFYDQVKYKDTVSSRDGETTGTFVGILTDGGKAKAVVETVNGDVVRIDLEDIDLD